MAEPENTGERSLGSDGAAPGAGFSPHSAREDEAPAVTDSYVARRVAEHRAAVEEASRHGAAPESQAEAPPEASPFGLPLLLGFLVAVLLLVVIYVATTR
jgi:hypothetical protein